MTGQKYWEAAQGPRYHDYVTGTGLGRLARPHVLVHHADTFLVLHRVSLNTHMYAACVNRS